MQHMKRYTLIWGLLVCLTACHALADVSEHNPIYKPKLGADFGFNIASLMYGNALSAIPVIAPGFTVDAEYTFRNLPNADFMNYLSFGLRIGAGFFAMVNRGVLVSQWNPTVDIDVQPKFQYDFPVSEGYLGIHVAIPVGVSLGTLAVAISQGGTTIVGWNIGILPGVDYYFDEHWGIFGDVGFMFHGFPSQIANNGRSSALPGGQFDIGAFYAF